MGQELPPKQRFLHSQFDPEQKKWQTEHRTATTAYPCYLPVLGEFSRSWSCRLAGTKIMRFSTLLAVDSPDFV